MKREILLSFLLVMSFALRSQPGLLDTDFANGEVFAYTNVFPELPEEITHSVVDDQDRIWMVGRYLEDSDYRLLVVRLSPDGTLDTEFGTDGYSTYNLHPDRDETIAGVEYRNNSLFIAGYLQGETDIRQFVFKVNEEGVNDPSFGFLGVATYNINSFTTGLFIDADGFLYLSGHESGEVTVTKIGPDGTLDEEFADMGVATTSQNGLDSSTDINLTEDGTIYVFGNWQANETSERRGALYSFTPSGSINLDLSFAGRKTYELTSGDDITILAGLICEEENRIYLTGIAESEQENIALLATNLEGDLEEGFGNQGTLEYDFTLGGDERGTSLLKSEDGILVGARAIYPGENAHSAIVSFTNEGQLNTSFVDSGVSTYIVEADLADEPVALNYQSDGNIIASGFIGLDPVQSGYAFKVLMDGVVTSTRDYDSKYVLSIYPNPAENRISISRDPGSANNTNYSIADGLGRVVLHGTLKNGEEFIDITYLKKGMYYLNMENEGISKFIKN